MASEPSLQPEGRARAAAPPLQRTLLRWLLIPLLALLLLDTVVGYWTSLRSADLAHDRSLHEIAREVALHVNPGPDGPRFEISDAAERLLLVDADDRLAYRVSSRGGALLGGDTTLAPMAEVPPAGAPPVFYNDELRGQRVRVVATWLPVEGSASDLVLVQVAETLHRRHALARDILAHAIVPQVLLIALALTVVYVGVRHGLVPLRQLRLALSRRSHRDLRPLEAEGVPAEVQPLVDEVNGLMDRLRHAMDLQARFIADAAHELKTPVSGLKAQLEMATRETDPQRLRHALTQLEHGVERMSRLVRQLLALARNEPGAAESLRVQRLDLAALALEVSMEWAPQALRRGIDLGFEGPGAGFVIEGDAERIRELLNNLIDNAVRYSRDHGRVTVSIGAAQEPDGRPAVRLSVHDDGPHIPPQERSRIFERFHRVLGTAADGSGLGLAIVSEIAMLHGAYVGLEDDSDGVGNAFSVSFPAASPS